MPIVADLTERRGLGDMTVLDRVDLEGAIVVAQQQVGDAIVVEVATVNRVRKAAATV
jgi:hypothetical protein